MRLDDGSHDGVAEQRLDDATPEAQRPPAENGHAVSGEPPEPPAERLADLAPHAELAVALAGIEAGVREIAQRLAAEVDRAAARERVIDRQHAEIERLRSAERVGQLRPVVTDLCRLRNDLLRQAAKVPAEVTRSQVANLLSSFAADVEEALERCGVAVLDEEVGAAFVPGRQQVAAVVQTEDPEQDGTVAAVVQQGYAEIDGGKIVAPARITLHRYLTKEKTDG